MFRIRMSVIVLLFAALAAVTIPPADAFARQPVARQDAPDANRIPVYVETPGDMEFSGRMIARPIQTADWMTRGLNPRAAARRIDAARQMMAAYAVREHIPQTDEYVFAVPAGSDENRVARELMASGNFQYVEPDWIVYPLDCPDDPMIASQWHHSDGIMQSCLGWSLHTGNPTTSVGICDTGIRLTHQDMQLHRLEGYNAVDQVWENDGGQIADIHGHGTATTGCAAANGDNGIGVSGVGWNLSHRMLRVSNSSGGGSSITTLTHASRVAVENGDKVASVSYSGVTAEAVRTTATYIKTIGGLNVWAAGNANTNLTTNDRDADDVIVVGATTSSDARAGFSNYGIYVDLAAPGENVFTTNNSSDAGYGGASGTSFSCPLTAGLIALIWSANPDLQPDEVEQILKSSCDDLGDSGVDNLFGYGRINVLNALTLATTRVVFEYPDGLPEMVNPAGGTTIRVEVLPDGAEPVDGTGRLHWHDGNDWQDVLMEDLGGNVYDAVLPAFDCASTARFYFSVEVEGGATATDPSGAPNNGSFEALAATSVDVLFADDFETDRGWTVSNENLEDGPWDRGVPAGAGDRGDPTADFDGSGACWLTDNVPGNSDVDGGPTRLTSPRLDLSGADATISYARWFSNDDRDIDRLDTHISNDDGASWTLVSSVGHFDGWQVHRFRVADVISPTAEMRIRFSATDNPNDSVTEAAIDAFRIESVVCSSTPLTHFVVTRGSLLSGVLDDLRASDNAAVRTVSGFGTTFVDLHLMQMRVEAVTDVADPVAVDVRVESRINQPAGLGRLLMRNWNANLFETVASFTVGNTDTAAQVLGLDGTKYVRSNGECQLLVRHIVFAPVFSFTFESFVDHVRFTVR